MLKPITEEERHEQQSNLSEARSDMALAVPKPTRQRAATKKYDIENFDF